ncbi:MAG: glycosyl hydrolase family 65 protein [Deltaproteobacteria bacterium]|nr:glycosyl hydrolase family 65 protein [Deltaproteobacteria bacterium]
MDPWTVVYEGFDPEQEALKEALCTLGNGYFATRGACFHADANGVHYPGTYLAGGYNRLRTEIAGRVIENEDLVNLPNWLVLKFRMDGGNWFDLMGVDILSYRQVLDLKQGVLTRDVAYRDPEGRETEWSERRLVHMAEPHLAAIELTITPKNWSGRMDVRSALDGQVLNGGVERYQNLSSHHLEPLETDPVDEETIFLRVRTSQSRVTIAQAARARIFDGDGRLDVHRETVQESGYIAQDMVMDLSEGKGVRIEKIVSLYTSRDHAIAECGLTSRKTVAGAGGFSELLRSHALSWKHLWQRFEMRFRIKPEHEDDHTAMILHLNLFHLLQTTSMHTMDLDVGVPSRGWHGEAYRGHIFWDELFIFPMLNLQMPEITRSLLMYRYRRLSEARKAAKAEGLKGAMYPWQSGSNGREESQSVHLNPKSGRWIPDNSRLQRHVNAAIAYNIYEYHACTGDTEFLSFYGAEMMLEIARFWVSTTTYNRGLDRYEILGVMGPDEYHDGYPDAERAGLNNNAYTNIMATWVLEKALKVLDILPEDRSRELCEVIDLDQKELDEWENISRRMRVVFHDDDIISQFEGYDQLEEFDWEGYSKRYGDIQRLDRILEAENDTPNRYKVSKQADALMLFYLFSAEELKHLFERLGYSFDSEIIPKNIQYYLQRTSHGSTLSRVVHAWVLTRSDRERSWRLCREALKSDYTDVQGGTTPEGIHLGAMAGSVNIIQEGYTGIEWRDDVLRFNPCLPEELDHLTMDIRYRGHSLGVHITQETLTVNNRRCAEKPIAVGYRDDVRELKAGKSQTFHL